MTASARPLAIAWGRITHETVTRPKTHGATGATRNPKARVRAAWGHAKSGPLARVASVSRAGITRPSAARPSARWGRYAVTRGSGAQRATSAATSGPVAKPADSAIAARRGAASPLDSSCTQAAAALKTTPEHVPASRRPSPRTAGLSCPSMRTAVAIGESAAKASTSGRRPKRSDARPPSSSPGTSPMA